MAEFERLIASVADQLSLRAIPYILIGGQAVLLHGEPRLTQDIDITVGIDPEQWPTLLALCDDLGLRPLPEDLPDFVRTTFVMPAFDPASGIRKIDLHTIH